MIRLLVYLLTISTVFAFQKVDCIHFIHADLTPDTPIIAPNAYEARLSWNTTLSDISNTGIYLAGYLLSNSWAYMSFNVQLNSINSTGTTISFTPDTRNTHTQYVRLQFTVIALTSCANGKFQLLTQGVNSNLLENRPIGTDTEDHFFTSSFDLTDASDYDVQANLRSFTTVIANKSQDLRITNSFVDNQRIKVVLFSSALQRNLIETVTMVILITKKSAFSPPIVLVHTFFDSYCFNCTTNLLLTNGLKAEQCLYSAGNFQSSAPWFSPLGAVVTNKNQSNITFYTNAMSWSEFNVSCYMNCGQGFHISTSGADNQCLACPANCSTCTDQSTCLACNSGYFNSSDTCLTCSTGCTTCTSSTACTVCSDLYRLSSGSCLECDAQPGHFLLNGVCQPCHSSCLDCNGSSTACSSCATGYTIDPVRGTCNSPPSASIDCLHIIPFTIEPSSPMTNPNHYSFQVSWGKTINSIMNVELAWSGFNVQPSNGFLSFEASIDNITSTEATVHVTPKHTPVLTEITLLQFQIIILTECARNKIELIRYEFVPTVLSSATRTADSQMVNVTSSSFNLTNGSDFYAIGHIQSFTAHVPSNNHQRIGIDWSSMSIQDEVISFVLYSHTDYNNIVTDVTFVILLLKKSAYNQKFYEHNQLVNGSCFDSNCNVANPLQASHFTPPQISSDNCLIAIMNLRTNKTDETPRGLWLTATGSDAQVTARKINWGQYNATCFKVCDTGFYYDGNTEGGVCILCPLECPSCYNHTSCCPDGHAFVSGACQQCGTRQYVSTDNSQCRDCPIGCATCSSGSVCLSCEVGYVISGERCETDPTTVSVSTTTSSSDSTTQTIAYTSLIIAILALILIILVVILLLRAALWKDNPRSDLNSEALNDSVQNLRHIKDQLKIQDCQHTNCKGKGIMNVMTQCNHTYHLNCLDLIIKAKGMCPKCNGKEYNPVDVYCNNEECQNKIFSIHLPVNQQILPECAACKNNPESADAINRGPAGGV